jgi:hypothetical protein
MESFYDQNYSSYEVNSIKNIFQEKVWNVSYDDVYDIAYIFVAKINQLKGYKLKKTQDYRNYNSSANEEISLKNCTYFDASSQSKKKKSYKDFVIDQDLTIFY